MQTDQLELRTTLAQRDHPDIKILGGKHVRRVPAREALLMAHAADYEWNGTRTRVKVMREKKPVNPWTICWRNFRGAAILPPSAEYWESVR